MSKNKMRGIVIKRKDCTIPMTKEEEQIAKQKDLEEYRIPRQFSVRINNDIPFDHKMFME